MVNQTKTEDHLYARFSSLLDYPRGDLKGLAQECIDALLGHKEYPAAALEEMELFLQQISRMPFDELQSLYSYTFELNDEYTLDMGSYLFEGFKRSGSLASIKGMYREKGFPFDEVSKGELPDHLPVVLRFLDFLKDEALSANFRAGFLIKGLEKQQKNFEKQTENPYRHLINALWMVVDRDVKAEEKAGV